MYVRDDTTGKPIDPEMTTKGMCKEIKALDSLEVGEMRLLRATV